jgi:hypothetical protein
LMDLVVFFNTFMEDLMHDIYTLNFWRDDRAILKVGVFRRLAFHCKILNMP